MAISDILFDAVFEIREVLRTRQRAYSDIMPKIEHVLKEMDSLRTELDAPPAKEDQQ